MQRPSRYLERSGSMAREKRGLDPNCVEDKQMEPKRQRVPALASVIVEALKVDSLQKLCSSLEPVLRRVVSEEVERALSKMGPARLNGRLCERATASRFWLNVSSRISHILRAVSFLKII